ncbi:MAG: calcium-binding protein, partial [Cyanobacteria bacterium J06642_2]
RFSVTGEFSYDASGDYEDGIVREEDLDSFDISFFDPDGNLLRTYAYNHLTFPEFNFAFDTDMETILTDGIFTEPDGLNVGEKTAVDDGFTGLNLWSKSKATSSSLIHVDDWSGEFGFPLGYSSHEDIAFLTLTTQELIDTGKVGDTYLDDIQDTLDEIGSPIAVSLAGGEASEAAASNEGLTVSLNTNTDFAGPENALIEDEGTLLTFTLELSDAAPSGGLRVFVDSNIGQILNRLNLPAFVSSPQVENVNPDTIALSLDNSGFALTIDEGATSASLTLPIFDNTEPDTFMPEVFDGLVAAEFALQTEVSSEDQAVLGDPLSDYAIGNGTSTVLFADTVEQLSEGGAGSEGGEVFAGPGNDTVFGSDRDDLLDGGRGDDEIDGREGDDSIFGRADNDVIQGSQGNDTISGGIGDDLIAIDTFDAGGESAEGFESSDGTEGGEGSGGLGNDTIFGSDRDDLINGDVGDDVIDGRDGDDVINGGNGNDTIQGGGDNDTITGGFGNDLIAVDSLSQGGDDVVTYEFDWTGQIARFSVTGEFSYDASGDYEDGIVREEDL